jgi:hypothetical protein
MYLPFAFHIRIFLEGNFENKDESILSTVVPLYEELSYKYRSISLEC